MSTPKEIHEREQSEATIIDGMKVLAKGTATYYKTLIEEGVPGQHAAILTVAQSIGSQLGARMLFVEDEDEES